jgi:hypothetical protein
MKIIAALVASLFLITACNDEQEAQASNVTVDPLPVRTADLGITLGTRYEFNADDGTQNKMRLFLSQKFLEDNVIKVAWTRKIGRTVNFFRSDTVDGVSYRDTGDIFLEYSRSF